MEEPILQLTSDGSFTIYDPTHRSHYHSLHGAVGESQHVYIKGSDLANRLSWAIQNGKQLRILEIGLGTGLNLLLTAGWAAVAAMKCSSLSNCILSEAVSYTAFEPKPLSQSILKAYYEHLQFSEPAPSQATVDSIIEAISSRTPLITLPSLKADLRFRAWFPGTGEWAEREFDIIYFDPFGPGTAPEMWSEERLKELIWGLKPGGCLTSFSVSGATRRILSNLPVRVERPPGFGPKREMLRVIRNII